MMDMVERVARAIYEARNGRGAVPFRHQLKAHQEPYVNDARAAIEAMRETSAEVAEAGNVIVRRSLFNSTSVWAAMIAAALSPNQNGG